MRTFKFSLKKIIGGYPKRQTLIKKVNKMKNLLIIIIPIIFAFGTYKIILTKIDEKIEYQQKSTY